MPATVLVSSSLALRDPVPSLLDLLPVCLETIFDGLRVDDFADTVDRHLISSLPSIIKLLDNISELRVTLGYVQQDGGVLVCLFRTRLSAEMPLAGLWQFFTHEACNFEALFDSGFAAFV